MDIDPEQVKKSKEKYYADRGKNPDGTEMNPAQKVAKDRGLREDGQKEYDYDGGHFQMKGFIGDELFPERSFLDITINDLAKKLKNGELDEVSIGLYEQWIDRLSEIINKYSSELTRRDPHYNMNPNYND